MKTQTSVQEVTVSKVSGAKLMTAQSVLVLNVASVSGLSVNRHEADQVVTQIYHAMWYVFGVIEALLGLRLVLSLLGANPLSPLVNMIYALSDPLVVPFHSTPTAMLIYFASALGIAEFMKFAKAANLHEVMTNADIV